MPFQAQYASPAQIIGLIDCPTCGAERGDSCLTFDRLPGLTVHGARRDRVMSIPVRRRRRLIEEFEREHSDR